MGKTAVAVDLAERYGASVLSADARQCYREMRIGTAYPEPGELRGVPHYFLADRSVVDSFTAGDFEREGLALLEKLHRRCPIAVVAGGSGLYVKALLEGLDPFPPVRDDVRDQLRDLADREGAGGLFHLLREHDPDHAAVVDPDNPRRLLRALEVSLSAGRPYSSFLSGRPAARPFRAIRLRLDRDRGELYGRIDRRIATMIDRGLIEEARGLLPYRHLPALDTVGYRELFVHFDGAFDLEHAVRLIRRNTRRYARRQITWLRRQPDLAGFHPDNAEGMQHYIRRAIESARPPD